MRALLIAIAALLTAGCANAQTASNPFPSWEEMHRGVPYGGVVSPYSDPLSGCKVVKLGPPTYGYQCQQHPTPGLQGQSLLFGTEQQVPNGFGGWVGVPVR